MPYNHMRVFNLLSFCSVSVHMGRCTRWESVEEGFVDFSPCASVNQQKEKEKAMCGDCCETIFVISFLRSFPYHFCLKHHFWYL